MDLILLGASAFLAVLTLILMVAPGLTGSFFGLKGEISVYGLMGEDGGAGMVFALIFTILELCVAGGLLAFKFLKVKFDFAWAVAFGAAFLAVLAGVFFFLAKVFAGAGDNAYVNLGVGAILCAIFSLLHACALAFYGLQLNKQ